MTKIEEIIEKNRNKTDHYADQEFNDFGNISVESAMKEYAEYYARKVLEIAVNNTTILHNGQSTRDRIYYIEAYDSSRKDQTFQVDPDSILNIKLPEHE